ncbi:hypothetical protein [Paracoccus sanguinis]|nr:hypothetical protein [Paracoccus sanguinis]
MERRLTRAEAKALLDGVVRDELERAATYRAARVGRPTDDEATERREDIAHGLALRLLADGGMGPNSPTRRGGNWWSRATTHR